MSGNNNNHCDGSSFWKQLDCGSGTAAGKSGETFGTLAAAIVTSLASAGVQVLIFLVLRLQLSRIYRPRSYLVPERERVPIPPSGIVGWIKPLFNTPNLAFIQKCGLDAYFFLRYLRMLLKIFLPVAIILLPILIPINRFSGNVETGLDQLSISNVAPQYISTRYWAHLVLAVGVIFWVCYVLYRELRGYVRVRQAFLTSPQHRIRASSTTVLVTGIPPKWRTIEALSGLYDVFPGGIRNIWINRNFDELATKVNYRDSLAKSLENAETNLIRQCWAKNQEAERKLRRKQGQGRQTKREKKQEQADADNAAEQMAEGQGISAGDQYETPHGLQEALEDAEADGRRQQRHSQQRYGLINPLGIVEDGAGIVGKGFERFGRGVGHFGQRIVGNVDTGLHYATDGVSQGLVHANTGDGFVVDDALYASPDLPQRIPPTPPPKTPEVERANRSVRNQFDGAGATIVRGPPPESDNRTLHPMTIPTGRRADSANASPSSERAQMPMHGRLTGPSIESSRPPRSPLEIEEPPEYQTTHSFWKVWQNHDNSIALPSPQPHTADEDEFPLNASAIRARAATQKSNKLARQTTHGSSARGMKFWQKSEKNETPREEYPKAFDAAWDEDQEGEPMWRRFMEPKERETMRVPLFSPTWCPSLPMIGKKVDRIYWTRRELARLNLEIEADQSDVEKFPYMNSAFIQFNHQIAAHMACQAVSHHVPQYMAPRIVEISPDDVLWENMSITWWERYIRTFLVLAICVALIIFYAIPVSFTSLLAKVSVLAQRFRFLSWLTTLPHAVINIIQGVLPPIILSVILTLVPIIFRILVRQQGVSTGNSRELYVQQWYFAFLFIQVFLVVTITGGLTKFFSQISSNPTAIVNTLAADLPSGADYFFSYLMVQALSNSASALLQIGSLIAWFVLAPLLDSTARAKWRRQTSLSSIQWGSFFPPFTNFAVIGLIYSVIAPLILVFMLIIFSVFWIVYRYNVLYVYQFRNDTGGLLFPVAINQLFTGLYLLELFLIGLFFSKKDDQGDISCIPQGIIMVVAFVGTIAYQFLLNNAFKPLLRYLPITLEDEAVIRDEEFARAQASKFEPLRSEDRAREYEDIYDDAYVVGDDNDAKKASFESEKAVFESRRRSRQASRFGSDHLAVEGGQHTRRESVPTNTSPGSRSPWHLRSAADDSPNLRETWKTDRLKQAPNQAVDRMRRLARPSPSAARLSTSGNSGNGADLEAQRTVGDVLFSGFADELEDLTPEERDLLVRYAFQHSALRAKRPVVWIPRDRLGVSDDEIKRAQKMSTVLIEADSGAEQYPGAAKTSKTNIWMSNDGTALDGKGKVVFRRSPPDFSNVDLIAL